MAKKSSKKQQALQTAERPNATKKSSKKSAAPKLSKGRKVPELVLVAECGDVATLCAPRVEISAETAAVVVGQQVAIANSEVPAADRGDDASALYVLGIRYSTGRDVEQDLIAAHKWFNLAAMMGHEGARSCRADISSEMTTAQIAEAQRQARAWQRNRDAKRAHEPEAAPAPTPVVKRPIYVRRRAQAMRSAQSFARICACA